MPYIVKRQGKRLIVISDEDNPMAQPVARYGRNKERDALAYAAKLNEEIAESFRPPTKEVLELIKQFNEGTKA